MTRLALLIVTPAARLAIAVLERLYPLDERGRK